MPVPAAMPAMSTMCAMTAMCTASAVTAATTSGCQRRIDDDGDEKNKKQPSYGFRFHHGRNLQTENR
jgi:hypothetical protein